MVERKYISSNPAPATNLLSNINAGQKLARNSMPQIGWNFDHSYSRLPSMFFQRVSPVPVAAPKLVLINHDLARDLGLDFSHLDASELAQLFSGNQLPADALPIAQAYAGHQFGHFTMLGDGRAILWGEQIEPGGKRYDLQFKGSGQTPYSRRGDGRAALAPMLREYMMGEAMQALGIATTRALAVVVTGEPVYRAKPFPGAVLTRVASSHIRVGTFEYVARQQDIASLGQFLRYAMERHYPHITESPHAAADFLRAVMRNQIDLIVQWMRVGFIHGVMNTDNMAISGETIDYGPCAFMDRYDPATVFSSIDRYGRYAFANQPVIAKWNLARLAECILPLLDQNIDNAVAVAEDIINEIDAQFSTNWLDMMRGKIGLCGSEADDESLIADFLSILQKHNMDYTNSFCELTGCLDANAPISGHVDWTAWISRWRARVEKNHRTLDTARDIMRAHNPAIIPRNHKIEQALDAAESGDMEPFNTMLRILRDPYADRPGTDEYKSPAPSDGSIYQTFCGT